MLGAVFHHLAYRTRREMAFVAFELGAGDGSERADGTSGATLIGWMGGETVVSAKVLASLLENGHWLRQADAALGAELVLFLRRWLQRRHEQDESPAVCTPPLGLAGCMDISGQQAGSAIRVAKGDGPGTQGQAR